MIGAGPSPLDRARWRRALASILVTLGLLSLEWTHDRIAKVKGGRAIETLVHTLLRRDLNAEDQARRTAGYYEELLNEGTHLLAGSFSADALLNEGTLISGNSLRSGAWAADWRSVTLPSHVQRRERHDFLYYDAVPDLNMPGPWGPIITNHWGMADREYTLHKPPLTRRIALLGDSLARGMGAPFGRSWEALFEDRLNQGDRRGDIRKFEILNFGVAGYRITQIMEVALEQAPQFEPDVYLVALTDLSLFRTWGYHIARLVHDGIDLKYDFLKKLARDARLDASDGLGTSDAKLAPYRVPALRWALVEMRENARRHGAGMVAVLVPTVNDPEELAKEFDGTRALLNDLNIPTIDLLDSFADVDRHAQVWVSETDRHPNEVGHRVLFENLCRKLAADPQLLSQLVGPRATKR